MQAYFFFFVPPLLCVFLFDRLLGSHLSIYCHQHNKNIGYSTSIFYRQNNTWGHHSSLIHAFWLGKLRMTGFYFNHINSLSCPVYARTTWLTMCQHKKYYRRLLLKLNRCRTALGIKTPCHCIDQIVLMQR